MKWCIDYLIIGFIVENIIILLSGLNGMIAGRWWFLLIIPIGIWGLEIIQVNLRGIK